MNSNPPFSSRLRIPVAVWLVLAAGVVLVPWARAQTSADWNNSATAIGTNTSWTPNTTPSATFTGNFNNGLACLVVSMLMNFGQGQYGCETHIAAFHDGAPLVTGFLAKCCGQLTSQFRPGAGIHGRIKRVETGVGKRGRGNAGFFQQQPEELRFQ
jgi:hypothetical protein